MCDIVTALTVASAVVGGFGQMQQGNAQGRAAEYQAQIDGQNAVLADRRARDAIERGQLEEERVKRDGTMMQKQQQGAFSAANIDTGYGSPLDLIASTQMNMDLDADIVRANAEREADDFTMQGVNARNNATLSRASGAAAKRSGQIGAFGSILGGGADVFRYRASQLAV